MSKHTAPATFETRIVEAAFGTLFGRNTPDRDGRFRAEPASNTEAQAAA